jgi:hypothetical protein
MKSKLLLAALLTLSASGSVFAQQAGSATPPPAKTREQVLEELKQAQASGKDMPTGFLAYHAPASKEPAPEPAKTATASKN